MASALTLRVYRGDELLRTERFEGKLIKIGRLASAHLRLEDDRVSRIHSVIELEGDGRASIVDMGSASGTFVNGRRVARGAIAQGDRIVVGGLRIEVGVGEEPATGAPATPSVAPPEAERDRGAAAATSTSHGTSTATAAALANPGTTLDDEDDLGAPVGAEVRLFWGDVLLDASTLVGPGKPVVLELEGGPLVVTHVAGEYAIVPPGGVEVPIPSGAAAELALGALRVEARLRPAPQAPRVAWWERANWRLVDLVALLAFLLGAFLVASGGRGREDAARPPPPVEEHRLARFVAQAPAPRAAPRLPRGEVPKADDQKPGESGERHRGAEGQMGKKEAPRTQARSAPKAVDRSDEELVKHQGLLAVLGGGKGAPAGLSTVLGRGGLGGDLKGAVGNMFGATVGDSFGFAGLGLKGTGQGGGGGGETIGIGAVGTKGRGGGVGGYGAGVGGLGKKGEREIGLAAADAKVMGAIDPELIRRVIREHASQVRYCYEQQLALQPRLQGKVAIRWQIDAHGRASQAQVEHGETTLASAEVQRCIMSRIVTWEFPKPRGGGVAIVKYPWILRTSGADAPDA